ncbi:hypothetical protein M514_05320, partial [Trichuris suis]
NLITSCFAYDLTRTVSTHSRTWIIETKEGPQVQTFVQNVGQALTCKHPRNFINVGHIVDTNYLLKYHCAADPLLKVIRDYSSRTANHNIRIDAHFHEFGQAKTNGIQT